MIGLGVHRVSHFHRAGMRGSRRRQANPPCTELQDGKRDASGFPGQSGPREFVAVGSPLQITGTEPAPGRKTDRVRANGR